MLKLINIKKDYVLQDLESVHALKGINLNFRKNEFVAILGPSGCGKTTLLNIIGGLDRYTSGDLVIQNKSTKKFSDYDFDNYRNHSIGFVFQSYNLIPHQTILQNVELALTIGGISKAERTKRAKEALTKVGLDIFNKKPNQMSGGQMQRVAIARALINNPEILLADEPTGALDSETSTQIMDLLKEVAQDRLVIMVTHNPDLAYKYANRIVKMKDGLVIDDSNPFEGVKYKPLDERRKNRIKKEKKSQMSFFTAFGLSISNLFSKFKRTSLVTIAGSIGIIGISTVLAFSNGIRGYIGSMQNDMLSSYPISIKEETADLSSLMSGLNAWEDKELYSYDPTTSVGINSIVSYLMTAYKGITNIKTNTITTDFVDFLKKMDSSKVAYTHFDYNIDVTNNIFTSWNDDRHDENLTISLNGLTQRYISELQTVNGFSDYASYVSLFTDFMNELPTNEEYILSQYDLLGNSKFATKDDEIMLVVNDDTTFTDLVFAQLGLYSHDEFINIAQKAIQKNKVDNTYTDEELANMYPYRYYFNYEEIIGKEFYYLPNDSIYYYDDVTDPVITNTSSLLLTKGTTFIYLTYQQQTDILVGIYYDANEGSDYKTVYLTRTTPKSEVIDAADILDGTWIGSKLDMSGYIKIDVDSSSTKCNLTSGTKMQDLFNPLNTQEFNMGVSGKMTTEKYEGYRYEATINDELKNSGKSMKIVGVLRAKEDTRFGALSTGVYYTKSFSDLFINDSINSNVINDELHGFKSFIGSEAESKDSFKTYVTYEFLDFSDSDEGVFKKGFASSLNSDTRTSFAGLFSNLLGVNYFEEDQTHLRSMCGLKVEEKDGEYIYTLVPKSISIYPFDFEDKDYVTDYLKSWNSDGNIVINDKTLTNEEREEISYSDTIELIVAVIDTLITSVTIALVVFTSLSLVVSCFMIAVITYISVMERVKEIGVIRSLGGRKKDVSRLFIAENLITGLSSGLFGVLITYLICVILNLSLVEYNVGNIGNLTIETALIMVGLSVFLSVISGLIPSLRASNQDPVVALRTE